MNSLLYLVLIAAPTAATPPPLPPVVPVADPMNAIYLLVGALVLKEVVSLARDFVKGLALRTVQKEDAEKEELKKQVKAHDDKFAQLEKELKEELKRHVKELEEKFDETDDAIEKVDRLVGGVQPELKSVLSALEATKAAVNEIRNAMEIGRDKQAQAHKEQIREVMNDFEKKMKDLEYKLRQDMTRAAHDAASLGGRRKKAS